MLILMPGNASIPENCKICASKANTFNASNAPQIAMGTVSNMIKASRKLSNCADNTKKITISASAKVISIAEPSCLNCRDSPA